MRAWTEQVIFQVPMQNESLRNAGQKIERAGEASCCRHKTVYYNGFTGHAFRPVIVKERQVALGLWETEMQ